MADWFRSWHGAPTDPKWLAISRRTSRTCGLVVAVAWTLLDRASQADDRGSIKGYDAEAMAAFLTCDPEDVEAIVGAMIDRGVIVDGRWAAWEARQPKREDSNAANRQHVHRERKNASRAEGHATSRRVTPRHASSRSVTTEESREEESREERKEAAVSLRSTARSAEAAPPERGTSFNLADFIEPGGHDDGLTVEEATELNAKVGAPPPATGAPERTVELDEDAAPKRRKAVKPAEDKLAGFDAFWAAYPKKEGKLVAQEAWPKALAVPGVTVAGLMAALEAFKAHPPSDPRYWPRASTWLNKHRWTDDYGSAEAATPSAKSSHDRMVESLNEIVVERTSRQRGGGADHSGPTIDGNRAE